METLLIILVVVIVLVVLLAGSKSSKSKKSRSEIYDSIKLKEAEKKKELNSYTAIFVSNNRYADDPTKSTGTLNVAIKGLSYRTQYEQNRARNLELFEELFLEHETNNPVDAFAIKVKTWDGYSIGYVDSSYSRQVFQMILENFSIHCFLTKSTNNHIPYQYMDICFLGENKKYRPPVEVEYKVVEVSIRERIGRLKENIKRSQVTADNTDKINIRHNALDWIAKYETELKELEERLNSNNS